MSEEIEKYKKIWKKFQDKMISLRKRKSEVTKNISIKFDQQKIEFIRKKLQDHA